MKTITVNNYKFEYTQNYNYKVFLNNKDVTEAVQSDLGLNGL